MVEITHALAPDVSRPQGIDDDMLEAHLRIGGPALEEGDRGDTQQQPRELRDETGDNHLRVSSRASARVVNVLLRWL